MSSEAQVFAAPLTGSISLGQVGGSANFRKFCLLLTAALSSWGVCQGLGNPDQQLYQFLQTVLCVFKATTLCG